MPSTRTASLIAVLGAIASSGVASAVDIEMLTIGNPGNAADTTGRGAVSYEFRAGTFEVTNAEYVEFLNAVAADDPNGLYQPVMTTSLRGGILRFGVPGSFSYLVKANFSDKPASGFEWAAAARFCNWLHNGQPTGAQIPTTTEDGAYDMSLPLDQLVRKPGATWFIPSIDEWHKAAHYDPVNPGADAMGSPDYWLYPTTSDTPPTQAFGDTPSNGVVLNPGPNVANYQRGVNWNGTDCGGNDPCGNVSTVGSCASTSPWGLFDMGGNIYEFTEEPGLPISGDPPLPTRRARGGDFSNELVLLRSNLEPAINMQAGAANFGMRVFALPLPCAADFNGDGFVGSGDFSILLGSWGLAGAADLDEDGIVGSADLAILLGSWGPCS